MAVIVRRDPGLRALRAQVRDTLLGIVGRDGLDPDTPEGQEAAVAAVREFLEQEAYRASQRGEPWPYGDVETLARRLVRDVLGLGPIQELLDDQEVEEISYNGPDRIFVHYLGGRKLAAALDVDHADIERNIRRMVGRLGRRLDDASPMVDVMLPDRARLAVVAPPVIERLAFSIRKYVLAVPTLQALVERGTLTSEAAAFLEAAVRARLTIMVSGGTASGKTTLLNSLGRAIPSGERIVTIEDTYELQIGKVLPDCLALQAREANVEGVGEITIRDLVKKSLRLRPSRIIVGEVRDKEADDMLTAMNSGHEGSMGTIHANSPRQALDKLATLVLRAEGQMPLAAVNRVIAEAIRLIVQLERDLVTGRRRVTSIAEVAGMEGDRITLNELFRWEQGELRWTGTRPRCADAIGAGPFPWA